MAAPVKSIMDARSDWSSGSQQNFTLALEKGARDMPGNVFGESDGAIVEGDVESGAIERYFANVVDA